VISPYSLAGSVEISRDGRTAFATIDYAKRANLLANNTGRTPARARQVESTCPVCKVATGGQVVENAEGFSIGPATTVGVVAALVILLITFGSLMAAGMPLITAGLGLITGVALIGVATHITSIPQVSPDLALMIGLGVGIDYALFHRHPLPRELTWPRETSSNRSKSAMDTSGRPVVLAGADRG